MWAGSMETKEKEEVAETSKAAKSQPASGEGNIRGLALVKLPLPAVPHVGNRPWGVE